MKNKKKLLLKSFSHTYVTCNYKRAKKEISMGIINISTAIVKDETMFWEYINKAAQLMKEQEVEVICRGKYVETMRGSNLERHIVAVFKYKDKNALEYFYDCEPYRKIVSLRDKACDMTIQIYSE